MPFFPANPLGEAADAPWDIILSLGSVTNSPSPPREVSTAETMADEKALAISQKTTTMSQACSDSNETAGVHAGNSEIPRGDNISFPDMKKLPTEEHQGKQNDIEEADISHTPRQKYRRCMSRYSRHVAYAGILILFTG